MGQILFMIIAPFVLGALIAIIECISEISKCGKKTVPRYTITSKTVNDTLLEIDCMTGHEFEYFVASLLQDLGFSKVTVTPGSGDQGIDVIAILDGTKYAFQCKKYSKPLGNKPIQEVVTGKIIWECDEAVVITNSYFTKGAIEAARATNVELWDRNVLSQMISKSIE